MSQALFFLKGKTARTAKLGWLRTKSRLEGQKGHRRSRCCRGSAAGGFERWNGRLQGRRRYRGRFASFVGIFYPLKKGGEVLGEKI